MGKCDICGTEMRMTNPRYRVIFDGWLYQEEKKICVSCFERIADEIKQAGTPQTDIHSLTDCDFCKEKTVKIVKVARTSHRRKGASDDKTDNNVCNMRLSNGNHSDA